MSNFHVRKTGFADKYSALVFFNLAAVAGTGMRYTDAQRIRCEREHLLSEIIDVINYSVLQKKNSSLGREYFNGAIDRSRIST